MRRSSRHAVNANSDEFAIMERLSESFGAAMSDKAYWLK